jgi:hypothetical protein
MADLGRQLQHMVFISLAFFHMSYLYCLLAQTCRINYTNRKNMKIAIVTSFMNEGLLEPISYTSTARDL